MMSKNLLFILMLTKLHYGNQLVKLCLATWNLSDTQCKGIHCCELGNSYSRFSFYNTGIFSYAILRKYSHSQITAHTMISFNCYKFSFLSIPIAYLWPMQPGLQIWLPPSPNSITDFESILSVFGRWNVLQMTAVCLF